MKRKFIYVFEIKNNVIIINFFIIYKKVRLNQTTMVFRTKIDATVAAPSAFVALVGGEDPEDASDQLLLTDDLFSWLKFCFGLVPSSMFCVD